MLSHDDPFEKTRGGYGTRVLLAFAVALLLIISSGYFSFRQIDKLNDTQGWISHTQEVRLGLYANYRGEPQ